MQTERNVAALVAQIEALGSSTFRWDARRDCVGWSARCVKAQTGINPLGDLRWKNKREAMAVLDSVGGLEAGVNARLRRINPAMAMRGDVAGVSDDVLGIRLMVIEGQTLVGPGTAKAERRKRSEMIMAWDAMSVLETRSE